MRRRQLWLLTSPGFACWALVAMTQQQTSHLGMMPFPISRRGESQTAINRALVRLIDFIRAIASMRDGSAPKVNILAHSMGGLPVRGAVQCTYPQGGRKADEYINRIVTLGTPHKGISFQVFENWMRFDAADEVKQFNPEFQADPSNPAGVAQLKSIFHCSAS